MTLEKMIEKYKEKIKILKLKIDNLMITLAQTLLVKDTTRIDKVKKSLIVINILENKVLIEDECFEDELWLDQSTRALANDCPSESNAAAINLLFWAKRREEKRPRRFLNPTGDADGAPFAKKLQFNH